MEDIFEKIVERLENMDFPRTLDEYQSVSNMIQLIDKIISIREKSPDILTFLDDNLTENILKNGLQVMSHNVRAHTFKDNKFHYSDFGGRPKIDVQRAFIEMLEGHSEQWDSISKSKKYEWWKIVDSSNPGTNVLHVDSTLFWKEKKRQEELKEYIENYKCKQKLKNLEEVSKLQ